MTANDRVFAGSIPDLYDRLMVPMIFDPYARDMAARVAQLAPGDVLETAAGTGALTRAMVSLLPASTRIVATDLNPPMLERAASQLPAAGGVTWQQADALALPFPDQAFDVVVCQFGMMFFPDKVQGYREAHRVLKPGGAFLFNAWDRLSENAFVDTISAALARLFPQDPPSFMARTPHGFHDVAAIARDVAAAGFRSHRIETVSHVARAATPDQAATAYCQGTPLRMEIEAHGPSCLAEATQIAADALARQFGPGPIEGAIRAHVITALS